jgi:hypothetical protein
LGRQAQIAAHARAFFPLRLGFPFLEGRVEDIDRTTERVKMIGFGSHIHVSEYF